MLGRRLPLNGAGVCGAALADLGLPVELLRGFALLARTAGLLGQLAEERRRPIGMDVYLSVDRNAEYVDPRVPDPPAPERSRPMATSSPSSPRPTTPSTTGRAPPTGEERPPFADEWVAKIERFRETLTRARPDVLVMVGSDHFHQLWLDNMPQFLVGKAPFYDANWYNEEREFGLPRMSARGPRGAVVAHPARRARRGFDLAFSNELRIDHSITCPIITLRPAGRPADRADLHQHLRAAAAAAEAVRRARPDDPRGSSSRGRATSGSRSSAPGTCRSSSAARASSARTAPTRSSTARPCEWIANGDIDGCLREVTLDSLHLPGNATHGFMDFMLMMGVAGENAKADHVDNLDLFHTMEAYFTWYPNGSAGMSKYLLNKFLFTVDRDPDLVERYRTDPRGTVDLVGGRAGQPHPQLHRRPRRSTWLAFTDDEREALATHDHVALFEMGAHPFLHAHPVHRDVRARPPRAAGVPEGLRRGPGPPVPALPRHRHLSPCAPPP